MFRVVVGTLLWCLAQGATVDPTVAWDVSQDGEAPIMIHLASHPQLKSVLSMGTDDKQVQSMVTALQSHATESQREVLTAIREAGATHVRSFWISNVVSCRASRSVMDKLMVLPEVDRITSDKISEEELEKPDPVQLDSINGIEWNVEFVKAPYLWNRGFNGSGLVHANADTGVSHVEAALSGNYRGGGGAHDYHWFDGTQYGHPGSGSRCEAGVEVPCDDNNHGTHTTGTTVGFEGDNQIGIAPGAKWIACRNMYRGSGSPSSFVGCLQWFVAPTDLKGENADASLRPHTVGNSYGCSRCDWNTFDEVVTVVRAAGLFMAVSAGNSGSRCSTMRYGPAVTADVCTVAASGVNTNTVASFSTRGPLLESQGGVSRRKPDITAPGVSVRSCVVGGRYSSYSGTSMAAPAVAGVVLLLWDALPSLRRDIDATEALLYETATPMYTTEGCGGDTSTTRPNNVYGYGVINAQAAYEKESSRLQVVV